MLSLIVAALLLVVGGASTMRAVDEYRKVPRDSWHVLLFAALAVLCIVIGFIMLVNLQDPAWEGGL
jgi:ABC-type dipeptide/oligopeptide/nickel transport system permease subunit